MTDKIKRYTAFDAFPTSANVKPVVVDMGPSILVSDLSTLLPSLNHALRIMQRCAQSKASGGPARKEIEQDMEQIRKLVEALK